MILDFAENCPDMQSSTADKSQRFDESEKPRTELNSSLKELKNNGLSSRKIMNNGKIDPKVRI